MSTPAKLRDAPQDDQVITYAVKRIPCDRIRAFAGQPRKWFDPAEITARAQSMRVMGQQDPVTVEPVTGDPRHDYELINGESRLRSAREAGIKTLWAAVRSQAFASPVAKHMASLVANFNRSDHTPMEISDALHMQITRGGLTQAEIARALGKSQFWVSQYVSLQRLHADLQALLHPARPRGERLAPATGFELARLPAERQEQILKAARGSDGVLSVSRVKIRAALGQGTRFESDAQHAAATQWTPEREARRQALHAPNPEHVVVLRAGIAEFRALLEQRSAAKKR